VLQRFPRKSRTGAWERKPTVAKFVAFSTTDDKTAALFPSLRCLEMRNDFRLFSGFLFVLTTTAGAATSHYDCVVLSALSLDEQGLLSRHWSTNAIIGEKFTVDRETGRVMGGPLDNAKMNIEVIDRGTTEMSFQAFSRSRQRSHTSHIEVDEYYKGRQKPFMGTTTLYYAGVYSGICE
jgi:hypothetical protein